MSKKSVALSMKRREPVAALRAEQWIAQSEGPYKRLSIQLPLDLHTEIKTACASRGKSIADVFRDIIEREFSAHRTNVTKHKGTK